MNLEAFHVFPAQTEWERKEELYLKTINYLDEGKVGYYLHLFIYNSYHVTNRTSRYNAKKSYDVVIFCI